MFQYSLCSPAQRAAGSPTLRGDVAGANLGKNISPYPSARIEDASAEIESPRAEVTFGPEDEVTVTLFPFAPANAGLLPACARNNARASAARVPLEW
jgi:hypothetical protein